MDNIPYIAKVAIAIPLNRLFDYRVPAQLVGGLQPGARVQVPFGNRRKIGVVLEIADYSVVDAAKLKDILAVLDREPLISEADMALLSWASRYYYHPIGEVFALAFPNALRKGKSSQEPLPQRYMLTESGWSIDLAQLQRSFKQQQLLKVLRGQGEQGLSAEQLQQTFPQWRGLVKALLKKQLLELQQYALPEVTSTVEPLLAASLCANAEQQHAIDTIKQALGEFRVFLLEGITGSGKTEVYMQVIQQALALGLQVLVLLPEITLTPQLEERFKRRFAVTIAIAHSRLSDTQRQQAWMQMQQGEAAILLGTRSALFTPFKTPGLIILDEEHDNSFKQQEGFRYSTRDVAIMRAKGLNIPVVLGSATPSFESYANVARQRFELLSLTQRAGDAMDPKIVLLDIRNKPLQQGLSEPLLQAMHATLARGEQVLIFLNRRGFAPVLMCHACAWVARCARCDANLVIHYKQQELRCHHCGYQQPLLTLCPLCKVGQTFPLGLGTERVEQILHGLFPDKRIVRLDRDSTQKKGMLEHYLAQIKQQQVDIILGTQMLAKGHHFPHVTLVALLDVDSGLFSIDFHAPEKLAQLIVQVAGRAGRAEKAGTVILQTRQPDHPLLLTLIREGYQRFAQQALLERQTAGLPPYSFQALLRVVAKEAEQALDFLSHVSQLAAAVGNDKLLLLGPVPAPMERRAGLYRYQLLLQAARRADLRAVLDVLMPQIEVLPLAKKVNWSLDIDPVDLY